MGPFSLRNMTLAAVALIALAASAHAEDARTVRITLEGAYAPWNMTGSDGKMTGFEPELAEILCKRANLTCELIASDWDGMIPALNAGKFDVIMDALAITNDRKQVIDFTVPYAQTPAAFATASNGALAKAPGTGSAIALKVGAKGGADIDALRDAFKGKTIGVMGGTVYGPFLETNFGDIATIREYKTGAERDLDVQTGRIDVGFDDAIYFGSAIEAAKGEIALTGPVIGGTIWGDGEALGVRKDDTELRDKLSEAIKSAQADGTIKTLALKWFKTDVTPQ
jgi:octopine/nopaline transport system substrate-binding protein